MSVLNMIQNAKREGPIVLVSKDIVYAFPFGIAYLAGYLIQKSENVRVLFRPKSSVFFDTFANEIINSHPLIVGFGSLYPDLYPIRDLIRILNRKGRSFPIVIGGQMVSPIPEFALRITGADIGVIGEGEIILYNLVKALRNGQDPSEVRGLVIRGEDTVKFTGTGDYIEDLSDLPPIPYDLFPMEKWLNIGRFYAMDPQPQWRFRDRVISIHGGRGCPYNCNFCYHSNKARYRKIPEMIREIEMMLTRYNANMIYFGDDLVLASAQRARELINALSKLNRPIEYSVSCRFDILSMMNDELLMELKRSGCRIMGLGIESGSQRILNVMHKGITVEQIVNGLHRLKKVGILPTVSIMVGQMSETAEDVDKSMALMLNAVRNDKYAQFAFTITTPLPGSELYDIALQKGLLKDYWDFFERFDPDAQFSALTVNFTEMTDDQVRSNRQRLETAFLRESARMRGRSVMIVESFRKRLAMIDYPVRRRLRPRLLLHVYSLAYDLVQVVLDSLRLRFLGLGT